MCVGDGGGGGEDIARCPNADGHRWQCPGVNVAVIMPGTGYYVVNTCYNLVKWNILV